MLAPQRGRLGPGRFLPDRIRCTSLGIFCTVSLLRLPALWPHSQTVSSRGAVSLPAAFIASILPGLRLLDWPVKCPLYARAIDIFGAVP